MPVVIMIYTTKLYRLGKTFVMIVSLAKMEFIFYGEVIVVSMKTRSCYTSKVGGPSVSPLVAPMMAL